MKQYMRSRMDGCAVRSRVNVTMTALGLLLPNAGRRFARHPIQLSENSHETYHA